MISSFSNPKTQMPFVVLLCALLIAAPISQALAQEQESQQEPSEAETIQQAETDARADQSGFGYGVGGFLCGIFGWLFATLSSPDVPAARLVGKSSNYVVVYSEAYKSKAKSIRTRAACTGWGIGALATVAIFAATGGLSGTK